jgi:hypothetical protein
MGIQGLGQFLRRLGVGGKPLAFTDVRGKRVAIDTTLKVYEMFAGNGGNMEGFTHDFRRFLTNLMDLDVKPTFVFDGRTAGMKARAHEARAKARASGLQRVGVLKQELTRLASKLHTMPLNTLPDVTVPEVVTDTCAPLEEVVHVVPSPPLVVDKDGGLGLVDVDKDKEEDKEAEIDIPQAVLIEQVRELQVLVDRREAQLTSPTVEAFRVVKAMITDTFGAGVIRVAPDDGERVVAILAQTGEVDWAVSNDYDTLVFGSPNLVMWFLHKDKMVILDRQAILDKLGFSTQAQFIDFAILAGCDFCNKVPGIGVVTAHKLMLKHGTIEAAWDTLLAPKIPAGVDVDYMWARSRFLDKTV